MYIYSPHIYLYIYTAANEFVSLTLSSRISATFEHSANKSVSLIYIYYYIYLLCVCVYSPLIDWVTHHVLFCTRDLEKDFSIFGKKTSQYMYIWVLVVVDINFNRWYQYHQIVRLLLQKRPWNLNFFSNKHCHLGILLIVDINIIRSCDAIVALACNTLQHTATNCNTLQHTAAHCSALQHTATH